VWEQYPVNIWWDDVPVSHWNSWRLFNLADDPTESRDLSNDEPEKLAELTALWDQWAEKNDVKTDITAVWPEGTPPG
jgi:arylsulfatase A-like enzyme